MSKTYCLLNHELTQNQLAELKERFGSDEIVYPSEALSQKWSQIPAVKELDMTVINDVCEWLSCAKVGDTLIAQGEYGSTFMMIDYALKKHMVPLYAVTKRVASERRDGEIVSKNYIFEHVCFRRYEYFSSCAIV